MATAESLKLVLKRLADFERRVHRMEEGVAALTKEAARERAALKRAQDRIALEVGREDDFEHTVESRLDRVEEQAALADKRARSVETSSDLASQATVRAIEKLAATLDAQVEVMHRLVKVMDENRSLFAQHDAEEKAERELDRAQRAELLERLRHG